MGLVDDLITAYDQFVSVPWRQGLSGPERQWMLIYPPEQERRIRFRMPDFAGATKKAGHSWVPLDLTDMFGRWLAKQEYADEYYRDPEALAVAIDGFVEYVVAVVAGVLSSVTVDKNSVIAVIGVA